MRTLLTACATFLCINAFSQTASQSKVTLKNGVTITGVVENIDVSKGLTITVGGLKQVISMSDIESIDGANSENLKPMATSTSNNTQKLEYGKYYITDQSNYPETYTIEVDGEKIEMVLVRGGEFLMGYDGSGSKKFDCEPIHKVTLSSFYVSKNTISNKICKNLTGVPKKVKEKELYDDANLDWNEASAVIKAMGDASNTKLRMITEAEWEYLSLMSLSKDVLKVNSAWLAEWCYDYLEDYPDSPQVNPKGPEVGGRHVLRNTFKMEGEKKRWRLPSRGLFATVFRIVVDAKDIMK